MTQRKKDGLKKVSDLLEQLPAARRSGAILGNLKAGGQTALRLIKAANCITSGEELGQLFSHTAFCQVGLPYRDPGDEVREWERRNGSIALKVIAGEAWHPREKEWVKVGLPYGAKLRLVQIYCDTTAIKQQKPLIETSDSLTSFVTEKLMLPNDGRTIRSVKDALARFAAADYKIGSGEGHRGRTTKGQIVEDFDIWFLKDHRQRILFPEYVQYAPSYFQSLLEHAVPLSEDAVAALSHNAMALDIYRWLAQRLHRLRCPTLLLWNVLHEQFGGPTRLADFRREFKRAMAEVLAVYPQAQGKVYLDQQNARCKDGGGLWLEQSQPPIQKTQVLIPPTLKQQA